MDAGEYYTEKLKKYGFDTQEYFEERKGLEPVPTAYPQPKKHFRFIYETFSLSIEEVFFWMIEYLRFECNMQHLLKVLDLFSASEQSAFFGAAQQRLAAQQDRISQFLATVGKMVRELFQLVRELRQIDERLSFYEDSFTTKGKAKESAEISLKGIWIDLVEQGSKNPSSVYGMAREMYFVALPDLFFKVHPQTAQEVEVQVNALNANLKLKEVLKRKLRTFIEWKHFTYKELKSKRNFTLKYLRQHYEIITMYMHWVKPYLKNIQHLQLHQRMASSPDLIAAFEGSIIELEVLAVTQPEHNKDMFACVLCNWVYRSRPAMSFHQEGYQRGPIHVGRVEFNVRAYAWDESKIKKYMQMREDENIELLGLVDDAVKSSMEELGDEIKKYIKEAGDVFENEESKEQHHSAHSPVVELHPFSALLHGAHDIFGSMTRKKTKQKAQDEIRKEREGKIAGSDAAKYAYLVYKDYKKFHGMMTW
ncbi:hypothetical protein HZB01_03800 [Candidatus Woesearchaeota archaeon]|nr:hypothetical protein [Candidatus Woesearchaeota archaeon]